VLNTKSPKYDQQYMRASILIAHTHTPEKYLWKRVGAHVMIEITEKKNLKLTKKTIS
jgi:hypothetical protein